MYHKVPATKWVQDFIESERSESCSDLLSHLPHNRGANDHFPEYPLRLAALDVALLITSVAVSGTLSPPHIVSPHIQRGKKSPVTKNSGA